LPQLELTSRKTLMAAAPPRLRAARLRLFLGGIRHEAQAKHNPG